jgi:HlyD family secretion protein/macrolide-specific efflux system membrane fusion protein
MTRKYNRFVYLFVVLLVFLSACSSGGNTQATPTPLPAIKQYEPTIFTVERGAIVEEQSITGQVVPSRQDELFFRTSGFVTRVLVKEGEYVEAGQLLAEMQVDDLLNQLEQANIDLAVAQSNLDKSELARKYAVDRAALDVSIAEARVALAELDLETSFSTAAKERAEINLAINQSYLELAKISLQEAKENTEATYEAQAVDRALLTVQRLEGYLAERQIYAPYAGVVLRNRVREGNSIDAFKSAIEIGDPSETVVRAQMDFDLRNVLNKDSEITLKLSTDADEFYTVQFLPNFVPISTVAEETTSLSTPEFLYFSVPPELQGNDELLSRSVFMKVVLGREEDALLLPPAAIRNYRGLDFVIVVDGDQRRRVEIYEIGLQTPDRWQITADLNEGDQVLGP